MDDYYAPEPDATPEADTADDTLQYFCKLTFGQFFTLVVLLVITVCFSFFLGARYGNQYLRLDGAPTEPVAAVPSTESRAVVTPLPESVQKDAELKRMARQALAKVEQQHLEEKAKTIIEGMPTPAPTTGDDSPIVQPPSPAPLGEPLVESEHDDSNAGEGTEPAAARPAADLEISPELRQAAEQAGIDVEAVKKQYIETQRQGQPTAARSPTVPVEKPATPSAPEAKSLPNRLQGASGLPYAVQVGAFKDRQDAEAELASWKARGYPAYVLETDLPAKGRMFRLRIGAFATRSEAGQFLQDIKSRESADGHVVQSE